MYVIGFVSFCLEELMSCVWRGRKSVDDGLGSCSVCLILRQGFKARRRRRIMTIYIALATIEKTHM